MLVLLRNHQNHLKDIFKCVLKKYNKLLFFLKKLIFFVIYNDENLRLEEKNIIKISEIFLY